MYSPKRDPCFEQGCKILSPQSSLLFSIAVLRRDYQNGLQTPRYVVVITTRPSLLQYWHHYYLIDISQVAFTSEYIRFVKMLFCRLDVPISILKPMRTIRVKKFFQEYHQSNKSWGKKQYQLLLTILYTVGQIDLSIYQFVKIYLQWEGFKKIIYKLCTSNIERGWGYQNVLLSMFSISGFRQGMRIQQPF